MADAKETAAPAKKTRKAFTRAPQSLFLIVRYKDENGATVALSPDQLSVEVTKDSKALVELLTGPQGAQGAVVKTIEVPVAAKKSPAETPAS